MMNIFRALQYCPPYDCMVVNEKRDKKHVPGDRWLKYYPPYDCMIINEKTGNKHPWRQMPKKIMSTFLFAEHDPRLFE